jgi:TPR repeat protein
MEAAKWFQKAADQNHVEAIYNLGLLNYIGVGKACILKSLP